ncbi:hypothetical protein [Telluribacter humicola]|nr:hypothetical protein [Telluribacter humicola]
MLLSLGLTSCDFIGTIFKGGVYVGVIMVILVIVAVIWLFAKFMGGKR